MIQNLTEEWKAKKLGNQVRETEGYPSQEKFRVIYKTKDADFCREDTPRHIHSYEEAVDWAHEHFKRVSNHHANKHVIGFVIEYW